MPDQCPAVTYLLAAHERAEATDPVRVEAERETLAEHAVTQPWRRCRVCISDRDGYPESWTGDPWPCRTVLLLAKAWGWEAEA